MKCEMCHKAEAEEAVTLEKNGVEEELYVCHQCAKSEKRRVRKAEEEDGAEAPPPFISSLIDAFGKLANDLEKTIAQHEASKRQESEEGEAGLKEVPLTKVHRNYRYVGGIHLEGLLLIGELDAVKRGLHALDFELKGRFADGLNDVGHIYSLCHRNEPEDKVQRVLEALLNEERNARIRLQHEMPRLFSDSIHRALAILRNCRLLTPAEVVDILSPLRLASLAKKLSGITLKELEQLAGAQDLSSAEDMLPPEERERVEGERADDMNERFEEVEINGIL